MTPKEHFNHLIKSTVAPYFKSAGYRKTALNFHRTAGDMYYVINFQNDRNSAWHHQFFINVGIYSGVLQKAIGKPEVSNPTYNDCFFDWRIDEITGSGIKSYTLTADTEMEDVAISVMSDIQHTVRFLDGINSAEDMVDTLLARFTIVRHEELLIYLIHTSQEHKFPLFARRIMEFKPRLKERWAFFENLVNQVFVDHGLPNRITDYEKD